VRSAYTVRQAVPGSLLCSNSSGSFVRAVLSATGFDSASAVTTQCMYSEQHHELLHREEFCIRVAVALMLHYLYSLAAQVYTLVV
jgi:hypothetical protein